MYILYISLLLILNLWQLEVAVKEAIRGLKNNKSAGPDNIVAEILKADLEETAKILKPLIDQIWHSEVFPDDWRNGHLTVLPKKGDLTKCGNYRGIMLLSVPGKVLSKIILSRIKAKVDKKMEKRAIKKEIKKDLGVDKCKQQ